MSLSQDGKQIRQIIKAIMKKRGYRYSDLASVLGVSVPTIKRMLTKEDFTLERLVKIADWLGVSVGELVELSSKPHRDSVSFEEDQEKFLAKNPRAFLYFHLLFLGWRPEQIDGQFGFSKLEMRKLARVLEKAKLIELWPGDRIRLKIRGPIRFRPGGGLEKAYFGPAVDAIFRHMRDKAAGYHWGPDRGSGFLFRPFEAPLRQDSYADMIRELREIVEKYRSIGMIQALTEPKENLRHVAGILMADQYYFWPDILK